MTIDSYLQSETILIFQRPLIIQDGKSGALLDECRHIGENVKVGVCYNFTDFSDNLTDLDYYSEGFFINFVGKI